MNIQKVYKKQFDANGNLLAEGYENAIAYYDSYEKLEGEAVKLSKKINSNYAKLDTEKYKSTDKQNPKLCFLFPGNHESNSAGQTRLQ